MLPPAGSRDAIVPILIDSSRSMRIADADGQSRLARAVTLVRTEILPKISGQFVPELFSIGDGVSPLPSSGLDRLGANARKTDLAGALTAIRDRYRGQRVAGIVLVSDGGDTGAPGAATASSGSNGSSGSSGSRGTEIAAAGGPPVLAVGVGSPDSVRDREV